MASNNCSRLSVGAMAATFGEETGTRINESNQSSQVSSRIWNVQSGQPSSYKTRFADELFTRAESG